ncbi:hypothetical protein D3C81_825530 [compost metagenome]
MDARGAGSCVPAQVLQNGTFLIDVGHQAFFADIVKTNRFGFHFFFVFLLDVGQFHLIEQHILQLFDADLGLHVIIARLIAGLAAFPAFSVVLGTVLAKHIPYFAASVTLADMLMFLVVMDKAVLFQIAEGNLNDLLAVRHNDIFFGDEVRQILLDDLPHFLLVTLLILIPFAMQRPILFGDDKVISIRRWHR